MTEENQVTVIPEKKPPAIVGGSAIAPIIPRDQDEAWRLAGNFMLAGMVPEAYQKGDSKEVQAKLMLGILKGLEIGLAPVSAISTIMIINNRPSVWGDGAIALVKQSGKMEYIKEWYTGKDGQDDWTAHCQVKRKGESEPISHSFSWADAKRAGLTNKGPWKQYPQRMLQVRPRAWCLRDGFADALNGLAIAEEVKDTQEEVAVETDTSSLD